jgi:hypothetical protein
VIQQFVITMDFHDHSVPWAIPSFEEALGDEPTLLGEWLPCLLTFRVGGTSVPPDHIPILQVVMMLPTELRLLPDGRSFTWPWGGGRCVRFTREDQVFHIEGPFIPAPVAASREQVLSMVAELERRGREFLMTEYPALASHPLVGDWLRGADYRIPLGRPYPDPI